MNFFTSLFKKNTKETVTYEDQTDTYENQSVPDDKLSLEAKKIVKEINVLLQIAAKSDGEIQSINLSQAKLKIELLKGLSVLHPRIELVSLAQVERDIKSNEKQILNVRKSELSIIAETLGLKTAHCPSCNIELTKFPKRKITCKSCNSEIYPRKNPLTQEQILINKSQYELFGELTALSNGSWLDWNDNKNELNCARNELAKSWGVDDPSKIPDGDAKWHIIGSKVLNYMRIGDWYNYKEARMEGLRHLQSENNKKAALPLICEFIYLTYNVPYPGQDYLDDFMGSPQVCVIDGLFSNLTELSTKYMEFMSKSSLPRLFNGTIESSLNKYKKERRDHYKSLKEYQK